jgi:Tol biopolymer transport system component
VFKPPIASVLLLLVALAIPAAADAESTDDRVAFVSTYSGDADILSSNLDGTGVAQVTQTPGAADTSPAWSPGGSRVAFVSDRSGRASIWVANADGSEPQQLTDGLPSSADGDPAWSPDGSRIAFASSRPFGESWGIWVVGLDGAGLERLTDGAGTEPSWSPDGARIAYVGPGIFGQSAILALDLSTRNVTPLTWGEQPDSSPAWSPDGSRVAFARVYPDAASASESAIATVNADGGGFWIVHGGFGFEDEPAWSPDGTRLVFQIAYDSSGSQTYLYVVNASDGNGGHVVPLPVSARSPAWAPAVAPPKGRPPEIELRGPAQGVELGRDTTALAKYSCTDPDFDLVSCVGDVPSGTPIDTSSFGWKTFTVTAEDSEGNRASVTHEYRVVDATRPTITIRLPHFTDRAFLLGQQVATDFSCADEPGGSGLTLCEGASSLDTATVGSKTFSVRARDAAGNETLENRGYDVVYDWTGFTSPLENPPAVNVFKAGHGVPVRFSLGGDHGLSVVMDWAPISRQIPCDSTELGSWGTQVTGSLSYNGSIDRYTYLWQTERAWAGTCRQFMLALDDRTYHFANLRFTK